ncbi:S9 family peptidase [Flavobacteriaceae bacterium TP-CH-4]|uniref:S9 family peptidase n=1 Tax=Pelagihabitans pacificus TaxID=2696054 RepID=A0A967E966_9FLAO|nr:S9 family peptidase [Pelagihabitans pacificus]NHF58171.1 S9 family peptidase [Pelagihabitans pacificus]
MKKIQLILMLALSCSLLAQAQERREVGNMVLEEVPPIPETIKERIQQYQNTRSASFADWIPGDKGILMATRFGNTTQLHKLEKPGSARSQITFFNEPVGGGTFCPHTDYNGFLFTKDSGGNEFSQIYWYDMDTRNSTMLSDGESVNLGLNWSNKGDQFAFTSSRRNKKDFDVYISNMADPKKAEIKIDKGNGYWITADWSPDDSKLLVLQYLSSTKSNSYIFDLKTNELSPLNNAENEAVFLALAWNKEGNKIYAVSDAGREFQTLVQVDVASGKMTYLTESIPWDIDEFAVNKERTKAAFTANENGYAQLYLMDLGDNSYSKVGSLPVGQIYGLSFHPEKEQLALVLNTTKTPGDIHTLDLNTMALTRWTYSEVGGLDTESFPTAELIQYETYDAVDGDKRKIPAFVYKPEKGDGPYPVLISIHGGPEGQHVPYFSSFYAYLVNELGIAVVAPNVRGSSGYGKSYLKLDNGFNREDSVKDIGKLIEWVQEQPQFDSGRIAVYGGSYGGYMVLSSMFHYNDQLKCGVDVVGISNFVTFLENTEEYRRDLRRAEYGDERDPKMREHLLAISPTSHVEKITKPLFVIQGANDPRVPASESEQMVQSIRENEGAVWYMLAKDEGHGFRKKDNRDRMTEAIALFLKENLID